MSLEKDLPKIVKEAYKNEKEVIKILVSTLIDQVIINENKTNKDAIIKRALEDEIDNCIETGKIDDIDQIKETK